MDRLSSKEQRGRYRRQAARQHQVPHGEICSQMDMSLLSDQELPMHAQTPTPPADRRIQRTRDALRVALMELMAERGWEAIDVLALCERANIGRSTFYQHFKNKEELLEKSLSGLRDALLMQTRPSNDTGVPLAFVPGLLAHLHENREVFRALIGRRSGQFVQDRFRELLVELVAASSPAAGRAWQAKARAHYLGGALLELLVWWLGSNRPQRPSEIEAVFLRWSAAVLDVSAS